MHISNLEWIRQLKNSSDDKTKFCPTITKGFIYIHKIYLCMKKIRPHLHLRKEKEIKHFSIKTILLKFFMYFIHNDTASASCNT